MIETPETNEPGRLLMRKADLRSVEGWGKAGDDVDLELWNWKFGVGQWEEAKRRMMASQAWPL